MSPFVCLTEATAPKEHHDTFVVSWSTLAPLITTSRRRPNGWPGGLVVCAWRSRETRSTNSWGLGTSSHLIAPPKANQACTVTARFHFAFPKGHLTHCPTTICCCLCSRLLLPLSKHIAKPHRQAVEHHALVAIHFSPNRASYQASTARTNEQTLLPLKPLQWLLRLLARPRSSALSRSRRLSSSRGSPAT